MLKDHFPRRSSPFSVLAAPALAGTPGKTAQAPAKQGHAGARREGGAGQGEADEGQCQDGPASQAFTGTTAHHKHIGLHKAAPAKHIAVKHVDARLPNAPESQFADARVFAPHCPSARSANDRPAHAPLALLMAVGLARAQLFENKKRRDNRVANSIRAAGGLRDGQGRGRLRLRTFRPNSRR